MRKWTLALARCALALVATLAGAACNGPAPGSPVEDGGIPPTPFEAASAASYTVKVKSLLTGLAATDEEVAAVEKDPAALAGLAPHACESGQRTGKRRIWGGRANVRRALYLAAFIASRCNPELKAHRERLQAKGKPVKAAIIATARKLLAHLNACIKDGRDYEIRPAV